ncbi:glycosyltransferase [Paenibacillus nasutitermitis]|uniref:Glycosyltransferase 2-like domain-containing protein n=1 Tax=Paenibacillus nasutitermitis TaxID=1652958 RepID=A0A916Z2S9_9BACL|nr:glycosyltransferase [Paenibacillus nasutitermitis]GGD73367.1 hypothetical protein GCM10010911_34040 [Paenibacillus nasutitermitis]
MKPKVSIIVPIYNMGNYLGRCMDSLLAQTYPDLEIVAVNDGSQDESLAILERYAEADSRVVIINQANSGVSAARNAGIKASAGQYIGFVDPDDWVDQTMYAQLLTAAIQNDADIVMCAYTREFGSHARIKSFSMPPLSVSRGEEIHSRWLRRLFGPLGKELAEPDYLDAWGTVWSKLYRSTLLKENNLHFVDLQIVGTNEDTLFNIGAFYHAGSFVFVNRPLYHYWRANTDSITTVYNSQLAEKFEQLYCHMETFISEHHLSDDFRKALLNRVSVNLVGLGLNIAGSGNPVSVLVKVNSLRKLIGSARFRHSLAGFRLSYCRGPWRIFFACAKLKLSFSLYLMLRAMNRMRTIPKGGRAYETGSNFAGGNRDEPRRPGDDDYELLQANGSR